MRFPIVFSRCSVQPVQPPGVPKHSNRDDRINAAEYICGKCWDFYAETLYREQYMVFEGQIGAAD